MRPCTQMQVIATEDCHIKQCSDAECLLQLIVPLSTLQMECPASFSCWLLSALHHCQTQLCLLL